MNFVIAAEETAQVGNGPIGFIAIAFIAGLTVLLLIDMVRRIRRTKLREEIGKKLDAEQAAAQAAKPAQG